MGIILGLLLPLLPSLISVVEGIFTAKKSGPQKLSAVVCAAQAVAAHASNPSTPAPTDAEMSAAVEIVLAQMKAAGGLDRMTTQSAINIRFLD